MNVDSSVPTAVLTMLVAVSTRLSSAFITLSTMSLGIVRASRFPSIELLNLIHSVIALCYDRHHCLSEKVSPWMAVTPTDRGGAGLSFRSHCIMAIKRGPVHMI